MNEIEKVERKLVEACQTYLMRIQHPVQNIKTMAAEVRVPWVGEASPIHHFEDHLKLLRKISSVSDGVIHKSLLTIPVSASLCSGTCSSLASM